MPAAHPTHGSASGYAIFARTPKWERHGDCHGPTSWSDDDDAAAEDFACANDGEQDCACANVDGRDCECVSDDGRDCECASDDGRDCECASDDGQDCEYASDDGQDCACANDDGQDCGFETDAEQGFENESGVYHHCASESVGDGPDCACANGDVDRGFGTENVCDDVDGPGFVSARNGDGRDCLSACVGGGRASHRTTHSNSDYDARSDASLVTANEAYELPATG